MDEIIESPKNKRLLFIVFISALLFIGVVVLMKARFLYRDAIAVNANQIIINKVEKKLIDDFIPFTATIQPMQSYYVDAIEEGKVNEIFVEEGDYVQVNQSLLNLSNSTLQLKVVESESEVSQLLNNIANLSLKINSDYLKAEREQIDLSYKIKKINSDLERTRHLATKNYVNEKAIADLTIDLEYVSKLLHFSKSSMEKSKSLQTEQLELLKSIYDKQTINLELAKSNLNALNIKSGITGYITGFSVKEGQLIRKGERIAQIDDTSQYKLVSYIDEFYMGRVQVDQKIKFYQNHSSIEAKVGKIYPTINGGKFKIDIFLKSSSGKSPFKRGQSFEGRIIIESGINAMVLTNGAFMEESLGRWVYVEMQPGMFVKRKIQVIRQNPNFVQVEGMKENERVIVSDYSTLTHYDTVIVQ